VSASWATAFDFTLELPERLFRLLLFICRFKFFHGLLLSQTKSPSGEPVETSELGRPEFPGSPERPFGFLKSKNISMIQVSHAVNCIRKFPFVKPFFRA
jgi:hypothetical protein